MQQFVSFRPSSVSVKSNVRSFSLRQRKFWVSAAIVLFAVLFALAPLSAQTAQTVTAGTITTYAGDYALGGGYSGNGGPATSAALYYPDGVAVDASGNLYIADRMNWVIRKVTPGGTITTVAGGGSCGANYCGDGGPATSAQLFYPASVAVDASGNLYIADTDNSVIRKVTPGGTITTYAGGGSGCSAQSDDVGDGCPATSAELYWPNGVAVDASGNLYISDTSNNRIRKVTPAGIITTVAGNGSCAIQDAYGNCYSGDGGPATSAELNGPNRVAVDASGNVYFADTGNNRIRKVTPGGTITTVAGNGSCAITDINDSCYSGDGGPAISAEVWHPFGVAVDVSGNLYIAQWYGERVRKVSSNGTITTVAGNGNYGYSGDGGPATSAEVSQLADVALDAAGNLYLADYDNCVIRKVALIAAPNPVPTIASLSPSSAIAGGEEFTLTLNGINFTSAAVVKWGTTALKATYVSAVKLTAVVPAELIETAGTAKVTVTTAKGTSTAATFTIKEPLPTITSLGPDSATADEAAFFLTIKGTHFTSSATVKWGSSALSAMFVSSTELAADVPASLIATAGTAKVTVTTAGGTSAAATFTVKTPALPTITSLSPSSATHGGAAFLLTVNGTNFTTSATVKWGSTTLTALYVSPSEFAALVPASLIATAGTAKVTVTTAGGTSAAETFTIK